MAVPTQAMAKRLSSGLETTCRSFQNMKHCLTHGAIPPTTVISINNCSVHVRQNLHAALLQLRKEKIPRELWIDALCIDQHNLEERASQVARMPAIYQRACHVIAWLGPESATTARAFELLTQLGQHKLPKKNPWYEYRAWLGPQFELWTGVGGNPKREWYELSESGRSSKFIKTPRTIDLYGQRALQDLLSRSYWRRVWIIQELAYARSVTFVCGAQSLEWASFNAAVSGLQHAKLQGGGEEEYWVHELLQDSGIMLLLNMRWRTRQPSRAHGFEARSYTLLRLLESLWDYQSSDPRDKIYALLGLPSVDDDMSLPSLDYNKSVSYIFCTMAKAIIKYERALNILCLHHPREGPRSFGLPSWVPDWTKRSEENPLLIKSPRASLDIPRQG